MTGYQRYASAKARVEIGVSDGASEPRINAFIRAEIPSAVTQRLLKVSLFASEIDAIGFCTHNL